MPLNFLEKQIMSQGIGRCYLWAARRQKKPQPK